MLCCSRIPESSTTSTRASGNARFEIARAFPLARVDVVLLSGIRRQVIKLRLRQVDQLDAVADQARQRRPVACEVGVQRLEIRPWIVEGPFASDERPNRAAVGISQSLRADKVDDRRRNVDEAHRVMNDARTNAPGGVQNERNAQRGIVGKQAMRSLAV